MTVFSAKCLYFQAVMLSDISYHYLLSHLSVNGSNMLLTADLQCWYPLETKACDRQILGVICWVDMFAFIG
ncbi:hypothetical protein ES288_A03G250800v1 [Gossypium darwinii]|uniref:Uncharacterized protein n=1 Tax=Gossypium darwinii TaxID=34276 RepID=A0A5D2H860_GOSDA|nr:hypothetical protein ES288_A03G250800v1 [Gossypium darwinii]